VWLKKNDRKKAEAFALKAVEYARRNNNNKIQLAAAQTALSNAYLQADSTGLAIKAASESYNAASIAEVKDAQSISASALAEGYYKSGDYKKAYQYLRLSKSLNDSIAQSKYENELATLQTSFKVNEKDKEIRLLAKDKELQQQKLSEQKMYIIVAIILAALAFAGIWLAVNRYKLKQRMKELELRNQIAADLHDEVGSSLSSIHMLSQLANQGNEHTQKDVLARMSTNAKETMDRMSDIVWMIKPGETESGSLKQRMERFAYEVGSSKNIETVIEIDDLDKQKLSMAQRKNIYLLFKEALNNAAKYSGTGKIEIKATQQNGMLNLIIKDHGKGFDTAVAGRGNGLQNMQNRAKELGGKLEIESNVAGTAIKLIIPI
jgi:signal transduction histidine kinase